MKSAGQFILCLAAVALISAAAHADDLAVANNPYSAIIERNVFALLPIPTNPPASDTPPADPPPKITANGIMTLFGQLEVLFKVTDKPQPGQPAKDLSYVLGVGDRQDDIEVTKIDDKATVPTITFINHGVEQEIPLDDTAKLTTPVPAPIINGGGGGMNPGMRNRGMNPNPGSIPMPGGMANNGGGFRGRGSPDAGMGTGGGESGGGGGAGVGAATSSLFNSGAATAPTAGADNSQEDAASQLTEEERIVIMEQQRAKWLDAGNPAAAIIPQTKLSNQLIGGEDTPPKSNP